MLHLEIKESLKEALKAKDSENASSIRIILGELSRLKGSKQGKKQILGDIIPDEIVVNTLKKLKKEELDRLEYIDDPRKTMLGVLEKFLPKAASKDEVRKWIFDNNILSGLRHPNQAISLAKKEFGIRADAIVVKEVVDEILSKLNEGM